MITSHKSRLFSLLTSTLGEIMKTVTIKAQATVYLYKEIEMPEDEADVFITESDDDIMCNIDYPDDIMEIADYELIDVSFKQA